MDPPGTGEVAANVHEVLDRSMIAADFWDCYIMAHRLVLTDPDLKSAAGKIGDLLGECYQLVGQRTPLESPTS